ncbi:MAG: MBL fold metallo-hydrolase [Anaerolineales bacterium]
MRVKQITPHLTQLTKYMMINCYLVHEDDGYTLVDTAVANSAEAILEAAGQTPIRRIVLTHAHIDHVGSLEELRPRLMETDILCSARTARLMSGDHSLDADEPQAKLRGGYPIVQTPPTHLLNDGDMVGSLRVVPAPGHTPGQIALFDTRDQTLIAGDAFSSIGGLTVSGKFNPLFPVLMFATWHKPTALASARQLADLKPARIAVGHGGVVEPAAEALRKAIS